MNKRIFICLLSDGAGGAEQVLKMIARYYMERNHQVDVYFLVKRAVSLWDDLKDKVNLIYTPATRESRGLFQLCNNLRKARYTYEYGYTSHVYLNSFIGLSRKLKLIKIKYLIGRESHSYFLVEKGIKRLVYSALIDIGYPNLDLLICQTDEMKRQFIVNKKKRVKKIETIPNPVNTSILRRAGQDDVILPGNGKYIVSAGRFIKRKGFDILIKSFNILKLNDYKLVILGEGSERQSLEELIVELNMEDKVRLPGFIHDVCPYFKQAIMCVLPSIWEGFPNVLLQMISQNTKVVSTSCADGIENIEGVFTCPPNDAAALAVQMERCLNADTSGNRALFDKELEGRSIDVFIEKIGFYLNE